MGFFYFLSRKKFYIHLLIAIVLALVIFWLAVVSLDLFTRHGKVYKVPDMDGLTLAQLHEKHYDEFFDLIVIDSVYDRRRPKGTVILQHPLPGSNVKQGRHIYLTIVSEMPEEVTMPDLINLSLRQALVNLETLELPVDTLEYVDYFARNAVVDQMVNGEPIEPGTKIAKGTPVQLLVGKGEYQTTVPVPVLMGKKMDEAHRALHYAYLNVGKEHFLDTEDTAHARVYKTSPEPMKENMLNPGDKVDIWYRSDEHFDFDNYLKQILLDSLSIDTLIMNNIIRDK